MRGILNDSTAKNVQYWRINSDFYVRRRFLVSINWKLMHFLLTSNESFEWNQALSQKSQPSHLYSTKCKQHSVSSRGEKENKWWRMSRDGRLFQATAGCFHFMLSHTPDQTWRDVPQPQIHERISINIVTSSWFVTVWKKPEISNLNDLSAALIARRKKSFN